MTGATTARAATKADEARATKEGTQAVDPIAVPTPTLTETDSTAAASAIWPATANDRLETANRIKALGGDYAVDGPIATEIAATSETAAAAAAAQGTATAATGSIDSKTTTSA